jgi:hypothetical protein
MNPAHAIRRLARILAVALAAGLASAIMPALISTADHQTTRQRSTGEVTAHRRCLSRKGTAMNHSHPIQRIATILAGLAAGLLALATAAPAALARPGPPGWNKLLLPARLRSQADQPPGGRSHRYGADRAFFARRRPTWSLGGAPHSSRPPLPAHSHVLATGGVPGWQIALIAVAMVLAAAVIVLLARARAARRRAAASPA